MPHGKQIKLSDYPAFPPNPPPPYVLQNPATQFAERVDEVVLYCAGKGKKLEAGFEVDAEGAMTVAMCKLELCARDLKAGGVGDVARVVSPPPASGTVRFNVSGTDYEDEFTKFDEPYKPPDPVPAAGWTQLSNRRLVIEAILRWTSKKHIGTDLDAIDASLLLGGYYALLAWAAVAGVAFFVFIASLLLGLGIPLSYIATVAGVLSVAGLSYGFILGYLNAAGCFQKGDYDMTMMGLFPIIYRYGNLLDEDSYDHILHKLLAKHVSGGAPNLHEVLHVCGTKITVPLPVIPKYLGETENHILMIETARFLTNQILLLPNPFTVPPASPTYNAAFDNSKNGMREWMLKHLQKYLQNDFWEFNSRIYARLVAVALQNLYEFSADQEVKKAARIVLDYLSAKFAVTSNGARRTGPFRRHADNKDKSPLFDKDSDAETWRFLMLAGDTLTLGTLPTEKEKEVLEIESYTLATAGLGAYRVPELVLDLMLDKKGNRYLQRIRHGEWAHGYGDPAMEVTFNSGTYLITGGGLFADGRGEEQAWGLPTTLMPTSLHARGTDWRDFIRIDGTLDEHRRANTGVAPGFACGLNPVVPPWFKEPASPLHIDSERTPWTFINCASEVRPFGFFVVVYRAKCDSELSKELAGGAGTFGFFAVAETDGAATSEAKFTDFKNEVLTLNDSKTYTAEGISNFVFPSGAGGDVDFVCFPTQGGNYKPLLWPIVKINGEVMERDLNKWDLATSEVFAANGFRTSLEDWVIKSEKHYGCVMVDNPKLDERLVLDLSDALHPRSAYVKGQRFTAGCRCPLSNECVRRHPIK